MAAFHVTETTSGNVDLALLALVGLVAPIRTRGLGEKKTIALWRRASSKPRPQPQGQTSRLAQSHGCAGAMAGSGRRRALPNGEA